MPLARVARAAAQTAAVAIASAALSAPHCIFISFFEYVLCSSRAAVALSTANARRDFHVFHLIFRTLSAGAFKNYAAS